MPAVAAHAEAANKANALLTELGATEDEVVAEFDELRKGAASARRSTSPIAHE